VPKTIQFIEKYMTSCPHIIGAEQPVQEAQEMMQTHQIRHLPVIEDGKIVGLISDRDVKLYIGLAGVDPLRDVVRELIDRDIYTVSPSARLDEVSSFMAEKKIGSALVVDHQKLVGIFTTTDAMRALSELLNTRLK
jgi:acetoin utilization protein AcuB